MGHRRLVAIAAACLVLLGGVAWALPSAKAKPMRGVIVSCPMYGQVWGSSAMVEALEDIKALGAEWVQIHPYARVRKDGRIDWTPAAKTGYIGRAAAIAKQSQVAMFVKPHLAYWGSFSWRGAITFSTEAQWTRFFHDYEGFIVDQARFAQQNNVPVFAVGTETDATLHRKEWTRIIQKVRSVYRGKLTYAANWDKVTRVPFWEQLDLIGVQGYFPVAQGKTASAADIARGWAPHLNTLQSLSEQHHKQVLFTEVGYPRSPRAGAEPWKPDTDGDDDVVAFRRRLMDVALSVLPRQKWFAGMFWWKWIPGMALWDRDFSMKNDEAREALRGAWTKGRSSR